MRKHADETEQQTLSGNSWTSLLRVFDATLYYCSTFDVILRIDSDPDL
jgi:hypothetical protein